MTKQLEKNLYLLDHSKKNILVRPRNPAPSWKLNGGPLNSKGS